MSRFGHPLSALPLPVSRATRTDQRPAPSRFGHPAQPGYRSPSPRSTRTDKDEPEVSASDRALLDSLESAIDAALTQSIVDNYRDNGPYSGPDDQREPDPNTIPMPPKEAATVAARAVLSVLKEKRADAYRLGKRAGQKESADTAKRGDSRDSAQWRTDVTHPPKVVSERTDPKTGVRVRTLTV